MSKIYQLRTNKVYKVGKHEYEQCCLIILGKTDIWDELWMILDYTFIGLLYYLNTVFIKSGWFAFGLFIWLMAMIFLYPREKKEIVQDKEELLEIIDKFYEEHEMDKKDESGR